MSAAFDTLRLARTLRDKAHFSAEQAEGMADAIAEAMQADLATKADVLATRTDLRGEIQSVRADLRTEIQSVRTDLRTEIQSVRTDLGREIQSVRADLGREIQSVRADLRETELRLEAKIEAVKSDLIKWVVGMIGFQTVVVIGAAVALARVLAK